MDHNVRNALVELVEEHITCLVREALSVQRHCKRTKLQHDHHHHDATTTNTATRLSAPDINMALQLMGYEKLYGTPIVIPDDSIVTATTSSTSATSSSSNDNNNNNKLNTTSHKTKKIMLREYLQSEAEMIATPPSEVSLQYHWLAVDGIQPEIPQNPTTEDSRMNSSAAAVVTSSVAVVIDQETAITTSSSRGGENDIMNDAEDEVLLTYQSHQATSTATPITNGNTLRVNQLQSSLLSEELKLYYYKVTTAIENLYPQQQDIVLESISYDPGLQELVPFFIRYIQKELFRHMNATNSGSNSILRHTNYHPIEHCRTLIRLTRSLLYNPSIHLELHLHELLPALVTCVVAEKLSSGGTTNNTNNCHYHLRYEAATVLYDICTSYATEYPTLKSRILRAYCQAIAPITTTTTATELPTTSNSSSSTELNTNKNKTLLKSNKQRKRLLQTLASQYGGIIGITLFGCRTIDTFLLPYILSYWEIYENQLLVLSNDSDNLRYDISMIQQVCYQAIRLYLQNVSIEEKALRLSWSNDIEEIFHDRVIPLLGERNEYSTCFI